MIRSVNVINAYERVTVSAGPFSRETSATLVSGIGVESAWLDRILVAACEAPVEKGESAVASFFVRTVAEIFPNLGVGVCLVAAPQRSPTPCTSAPSIGEQHLFKYVPEGEERRGEGVDPTRLFPGYAHERVLHVEERGSTLHVASDDASIIASDSPMMFVVRRAVFAMSRGLGLARLHAKAADDARELRALTSQMVQAEKLASLGQIAAGVVHELNNPLTSIVAYTGWLLRKTGMKDDPDSMERLRRIEESSNRILRFTRDLVAYARPSSEVAVQVSLEHVIEQALAFCEHVIAEHGVVVERRFSRAVPDVRGMPEQLAQVFVNLFTNACHAVPARGGVLSISTELQADGSHVRVMVEDNGHGIASEHMHVIFAPFFTTRVDGGGTGLGLSIVKNILDRHGAEIWAERAPSGGARFVSVFPILRSTA
ncbi:MAG: ATP-binding protein [Polyangiaceae bacterium]|nr:ATP-binding protein [Polyangiaceae bacterium]